MKIDSAQITNVRKAGLTMYESLSLGTQILECTLSVLSGLILEKTCELFVGTNETVRNVRCPYKSGCP